MAISAKLKMDGSNELEDILSLTYNFNQSVDHEGKPAGPPMGGELSISVDVKDPKPFWTWAIDRTTRKKGTITFYKRNAGEKIYTIEFGEGFLTGFSLYDSSVTPGYKTLALNIDAGNLTIHDVEIKKEHKFSHQQYK
jgi:hypothetical protein